MSVKFLEKLCMDKIKMNWNKNPIEMTKFLSFLTVPINENKNCFGYENDWREYKGKDDLIIKGGRVKGVEYLNSIQYKLKLMSTHHNYVNPFYIFDIMNEDGKKFFLEYYADDIKRELDNAYYKQVQAQDYYSEVVAYLKGVRFEHIKET